MTENVGVFKSAEVYRIEALPRRPQEWSPEALSEAVDLLTAHLKTPQGTMRLKPVQARALCEASDTRSLIAPIGAGQGKHLLGDLLPVILGAQRTLLLVPAHLRQQTYDEYEKMAKHWRLLPLYGLDAEAITQPHVRLLSYQSLSTVRFASFLEEFCPDLIIADEAHFLAHMRSARGKRMFRYIRQAQRSGTGLIFIPMSGTLIRKRIRECAHLYSAALGDRSPFPNEWADVEQWSYALDEGIREDTRLAPGALSTFLTADEAAQGLHGLRCGIRRRILETPGVVATTESGVDVSLVLQVRDIEVPEVVREAMRKIREDYALPTGETFDAGITAWNHARECATGFVYHYDPPPPEEWKLAKTNWQNFVRDAIDHPPLSAIWTRCAECVGAGCKECEGKGKVRKRLVLDSPLMVWNAVAQGHFGDPEKVSVDRGEGLGIYTNVWNEWKSIRDTFTPNPVPHWISDYLVKDAEDLAIKEGSIIWVGHTSAFTKADLDQTDSDEAIGNMFKRIPYFGAGPAGLGLRTYKGPCVASIRAHGTGANLTQWSKAIILCLPSSGAAVEQLLARHHRHGQEADEVTFTFYLHSREMFQAYKTAVADAHLAEDLCGNSQRILSSVILAPDGHSFDPLPYDLREESLDPMWSK